MKTHDQLSEIVNTVGSQVSSSFPKVGLIVIAFNRNSPASTPVAMTGSAPSREYAARLLRSIADELEARPGTNIVI